MMYRKFNEGTVEVIAGSMFAGKTTELIRRLNIMTYTDKKILAFRAAIDNRYDETQIATHNGTKFPAHAVNNAKEAALIFKDNSDAAVVAFDEIQFMDESIIEFIDELATRGVRVICAGLNTDFRGEPFPIMKELMARAEFITKLESVCNACGAPGTRSQRLVNKKPANWSDPVVVIGAQEAYEPRCRHCHEVPGKPKFII